MSSPDVNVELVQAPSDAVASPTRVPAKWLWVLLFVALTLGAVVPLLFVAEPPMLDYANHLARAFVLHHLGDPHFQFAKWYEADWGPYPYILADIGVAGLQSVMPIDAAGKVMLALSAIFIPLSVVWFLWQANRQEMKLAIVACAFALPLTWLEGFVSYELGIAGCFLMAGTWLWYRRQPTLVRAAVFVISSFAAYFSHLLGFAAGALIVVAYATASERMRGFVRASLFFVPQCLLFLWSRPGLATGHEMFFRPLGDKWPAFFDTWGHGYFERWDTVFGWGFVACFLIGVLRNREFRWDRRWAFVVAALAVAYLALPYSFGEAFDIDVRLAVTICLTMLAVFRFGRRTRWVVVLAAVLAVIRIANITAGFIEQKPVVAAMNGGVQAIAPGSRVLPIIDTCDDDDVLSMYHVHWSAYVVIRRGAFSPYLFDIPGQTPMRISANTYTDDQFWEHCYDSPSDWAQVATDYDYVWNYGSRRHDQDLSTIGDLVYSAENLRVYRIRKKS